MNKSAASIVLASSLGLAALAGCGSNSATSSPSTSVSSTTSTASPSATDAASQSPSDTTSAASPTGAAATSASSTPSATSTTSARSSATAASPTASISLPGIPRTAEGWRITVPFGWGGATEKSGGSTYHLWTADKSTTTNLTVATGQMNKGESFDADLKDSQENFRMSSTDINAVVSVPGADSARELAGMSVNGKKEAYVDMVIAHKGRDVVIAVGSAPSRAALNSAGLHQDVRSLARA